MPEFGSQLILLAAGGSLGTVLRYLTYQFADKYLNQHLPWGTLLVNLIGSFIIGLVWGVMEKSALAPAWRFFLIIGVLGSFTTFSAFVYDSFYLFNQGQFKMLLINLLLNNGLGLLLCGLGFYGIKLFA
jgi:CrcB protein